MVRFVLAVLAGTVISFAIAFMVCMLFPWTAATAQSLPNDEIVTRAMYDNIPASGVYLFPALSKDGKPPTMQDMEAWNSKAKAGPTGILYFARDGVDADGPAPLLKGLGIHLLASLLAAGLLALAALALRNYFARVLFVGALGVFATLAVFGCCGRSSSHRCRASWRTSPTTRSPGWRRGWRWPPSSALPQPHHPRESAGGQRVTTGPRSDYHQGRAAAPFLHCCRRGRTRWATT
jgi:hypothetical protein